MKNMKNIEEAPDYRFTLANERTFLAWLRTALAFFATSVVIDKLSTDINLSIVKEIVVALLCLTAAAIAIVAYFKWQANEKAMRLDLELPQTGFAKVCVFTILVSTCALLMVML